MSIHRRHWPTDTYCFQPPETPRNVRGHNIAYYHALVRAYENLGSVFKRGDYNALMQEIQAGQSLWEDVTHLSLQDRARNEVD